MHVDFSSQRLRSSQSDRLEDWEVIMEEFTAAIDPKVLQEMYNRATSDPCGFLFMDMKNNKFDRSFKSELKAS